MYTFSDIADILQVVPEQAPHNPLIEQLLTDSRKLVVPESTLFFTIHSVGRSANPFVETLYEQGVRAFVVDESYNGFSRCTDASFIVVRDVVDALQKLAKRHRVRFSLPVIGITGSNGKTVVKEWLYHLLNHTYQIVKSPKSYNSQIGVPLSIWQINNQHTLGIFEAGISQTQEMERLNAMIRPSIGVITSIGEAHASGFKNVEEKIEEKLSLFEGATALIYGSNDPVLKRKVGEYARKQPGMKILSWGSSEDNTVCVLETITHGATTSIHCRYKKALLHFNIPFADVASVSNALTCITVLLYLNVPESMIREHLHHLPVVEMRLEMKEGIQHCSVINDSYISDLTSLSIALDFLEQQHQHPRRTVFLSDIYQLRKDKDTTYRYVSALLNKKKIDRLIAIGEDLMQRRDWFAKIPETHFFPDTESFLLAYPQFTFQHETILLKGARVFGFERIMSLLETKTHDAVFEINLSALRNNLRFYQNHLRNTKLMVMVKAFSYGTGSFEIANILQHAKVDYLAVAYPDEGVELRQAGVRLPIMVMNTEEAGFANMVKYNLEPEIYSFRIATAWIRYLEARNITGFPVHLKLDTGMHRLGFEWNDITNVCMLLRESPQIKVQSVFSHLVGSENPSLDTFTKHQAELFNKMCDEIAVVAGNAFLRHLGNSAAITRHPDLRYDMVRLGIGLYGMDSVPEVAARLQEVGTLKTTISQIRVVKAGDTVGYNRAGRMTKDSTIATIRIGYADGYPRMLGNGNGQVWINGKKAPVVGNVCMDMTMVDVSGIDAREGDTVILFGPQYSVQEVASRAGTIPYEILTGISQRIKRVYYHD